MSTREPRVPYGAWIEKVGRQGRPAFCLAEQLSAAGMTLKPAEAVTTDMSLVRMHLLVENESEVLSMDAEVVDACDEGGHLAVRFVNLPAAHRSFIKDLLAEVSC